MADSIEIFVNEQGDTITRHIIRSLSEPEDQAESPESEETAL